MLGRKTSLLMELRQSVRIISVAGLMASMLLTATGASAANQDDDLAGVPPIARPPGSSGEACLSDSLHAGVSCLNAVLQDGMNAESNASCINNIGVAVETCYNEGLRPPTKQEIERCHLDPINCGGSLNTRP